MTLTPRRPHTTMDLKYLLRTQEGLPLYTQTILVSWPPRSLMESTTARVLSLVQAAPRATWLVRLGFFQDLLGKMAAAPAHSTVPSSSPCRAPNLTSAHSTSQGASAHAAGVASRAASWSYAIVLASIHGCLGTLQQQAAEEQAMLQ